MRVTLQQCRRRCGALLTFDNCVNRRQSNCKAVKGSLIICISVDANVERQLHLHRPSNERVVGICIDDPFDVRHLCQSASKQLPSGERAAHYLHQCRCKCRTTTAFASAKQRKGCLASASMTLLMFDKCVNRHRSNCQAMKGPLIIYISVNANVEQQLHLR